MTSITTGINTNLSNTIDATTIMGSDAIEYNDPLFSNGSAVRAYGPGQTIIDTGYFPPGVLTGAISLQIYNNSNVAHNTDDVFHVYIYRLDEKTGTETLESQSPYWSNPHSFSYMSDKSLEVGRVLSGFYNPRYSYRVVVTTSHSIDDDDYVDIDYIQFALQPTLSMSGNWVSHTTSVWQDYDYENDIVQLPGIETQYIEITGDGANFKTKTVTLKNYWDADIIQVSGFGPDFIPYVAESLGRYDNTCVVGVAHKDVETTFTGTQGINVMVTGRVIVPTY